MNDQLPDGFLVGDRFARHPIPFIHRPEDLAFTNFRGSGPGVDSHLHRGGYRDGAEPVPFPHQVRYDPATFALLDPVNFEAHELGAAQPATIWRSTAITLQARCDGVLSGCTGRNRRRA